MIPQQYIGQVHSSFVDEMYKIAAGEGLLMKTLSLIRKAPSAVRSALPGSVGAVERASFREAGRSGRILRSSKTKMKEAVRAEGGKAAIKPAVGPISPAPTPGPKKPVNWKRGAGIAVGLAGLGTAGAAYGASRLMRDNPGAPIVARYPGAYV